MLACRFKTSEHRYDVAEPPAQVTELSLLYIEGLVLHSQLHPCLASTGGVGKVAVTKVRFLT